MLLAERSSAIVVLRGFRPDSGIIAGCPLYFCLVSFALVLVGEGYDVMELVNAVSKSWV